MCFTTCKKKFHLIETLKSVLSMLCLGTQFFSWSSERIKTITEHSNRRSIHLNSMLNVIKWIHKLYGLSLSLLSCYYSKVTRFIIIKLYTSLYFSLGNCYFWMMNWKLLMLLDCAGEIVNALGLWKVLIQ